MKIGIVGAGWAGLAAAVGASQAGHNVVVFEAARFIGGRARAINGHLPDGSPVVLDNGQHIMIGAYTETLRIMRLVGVNVDKALLRLPLALKFPDGMGIDFQRWHAPLDALAGILGASGWRMVDKLSLLKAAAGWHFAGFNCPPSQTVSQLCHGVSLRVMSELIEPLCVSALNTPSDRASGQVFLRVMHDALLGANGGSNLLLPRVDLSAVFPQAAAQWVARQGGQIRLGARVDRVQMGTPIGPGQWHINGESFDVALFATTASSAVKTLIETAQAATGPVATAINNWVRITAALQYEAITTVYAWGPQARLTRPMFTLRSHAGAPAQFVFDRGQLGGPLGLLAFVVSASADERDVLQTQVLAQARQELDLDLVAVQTIVEKRATFACTPGLMRPPIQIAPGLVACGDYIEGPYPATLEGAVRSGLQAADAALAAAATIRP